MNIKYSSYYVFIVTLSSTEAKYLSNDINWLQLFSGTLYAKNLVATASLKAGEPIDNSSVYKCEFLNGDQK
jgi:hypothetical protein